MFPKENRLVLLGDMAASPEILKGREIVTPPVISRRLTMKVAPLSGWR